VTVLYWFRNDLRLADNPAFAAACVAATALVPVYCHDDTLDAGTTWGFPRVGEQRRAWQTATLADLRAQLEARGSGLVELRGAPADVLPDLARQLDAQTVYCEAIEAPEEQDAIAALRAAGLDVRTQWQSSMLVPGSLPFAVGKLPDVFTAFRSVVEKAGIVPAAPVPVPARIPLLPSSAASLCMDQVGTGNAAVPEAQDPRSSFPTWLPEFTGGETAAHAHLQRYFAKGLAQSYKLTRNGLAGTDYSSKFSPWLATGALSARVAYAALKACEREQGANDSTYWLWFELMWRDYFRFLHLKYGRKLYRGRGLQEASVPAHNAQGFRRWCEGRTGEPFIDAGMRELAATGYLSNRMRQNVASYLVHDLRGDWRAGAAWFESRLIDYDVYSNQGNWLYVAGRGTDPRGSRRFDPGKQARDYDPHGQYRKLWDKP
jgi:deoxyribodipyrimidine photo-lyase